MDLGLEEMIVAAGVDEPAQPEPDDRQRRAWRVLASSGWTVAALERRADEGFLRALAPALDLTPLAQEITLGEVVERYPALLRGRVRGRTVVRVGDVNRASRSRGAGVIARRTNRVRGVCAAGRARPGAMR